MAEVKKGDLYDSIRRYSSRHRSETELVLRHLGHNEPLESEGAEAQTEEAKRRFGVSVRRVELKGEWYKNMLLPLLVEYEGEMKAVVPDFSGQGIMRLGKRRVRMNSAVAEKADNTGICFYRGFSDEKITRRGLLKYMLGCVSVREYAVIAAAAVMVSVFAVAFPQVQYYIFNNVVPSGTTWGIPPACALLLGIAAISAVLNIFRGTVSANMSLIIGANFQSALASRLLRLRSSFFSDRKAGSLSRTIITFSDLSGIFSGENVAALLSFVLSFIYAAAIASVARNMLGLVLGGFVFTVILNIIYIYAQKRYTARCYESTNEMSGFVYELFGGMESVKLNNAAFAMTDRWSRYYAETVRARESGVFLRHFNSIYTLVTALYMLLIYAAGMKSDITAASFATFLSLYALFMVNARGIGRVLDAVMRFNMAYDRLREFLSAGTEENEGKISIDTINNSIEFSNVSFRYPSMETNVLENVSFKIEKGKRIGITGSSGSGKSTLLRLLLGFERPQSGRIYVDHANMNEIDLSSYRRNLGVVLQDSKLIPGDIYTNITMTAPGADIERVNAAMEAVGIRDEIESMPMGLHTVVSESSMTVSGGQKQRLLLARAVINEPFMLVLDEATSALDNAAQAEVTDYINKAGITTVMVAHRLSTIKDCDEILVLDRGTIAERGSYEELTDKKGVFYELVKNQMTQLKGGEPDVR